MKNLVLTLVIALFNISLCHPDSIASTQKLEQAALLDIATSTNNASLKDIAINELAKNIQNQESPLPTDISCFIADIKFDGEHIKILEFGEITKSYFKGHDTLYGKGKIWEGLWNILADYKLPMWYVGKKLEKKAQKDLTAFKTFVSLGGKTADTMELLKQHETFKKQKKRGFSRDEQCINNHKGIVAIRRYRLPKYLRNKFIRENPGFLILSDAAAPFVGNKYRTSQLFDDEELKQFRPRWKKYSKRYKPELAQTIINDLQTDTVVIKPLNSANGWGVIIVDKDELDETLQLILCKDNKTTLRKTYDKTYSHWARDNNRSFIVESYEKSKPITVANNQFDATMRMVFVLTHECNDIGLQFLGGYWKLPVLALSEEGTLTEKHKSKISTKRPSSAEISPEDTKKVQDILSYVLPKIYRKMLEHKKDFLEKLLA